MIINLNDQYRIITDVLNCTLQEKKITTEKSKNAGQEYWSDVSYYPNLESAVKGIVKRQIQTSEVEGIKNIIAKIRAATDVIMQQISILKDESQYTEYLNNKQDPRD